MDLTVAFSIFHISSAPVAIFISNKLRWVWTH